MDLVPRHRYKTRMRYRFTNDYNSLAKRCHLRGLGPEAGPRNPFDGVFHRTTTQDQTSSVVFSEFIRNVFAKSLSDVALFVDRGMNNGYLTSSNQHLFLPFFRGPDDRLALAFLGQLCENPSVTATVVRLVMKDEAEDAEDLKSAAPLNNTLLYQNVSDIISSFASTFTF
jgi:hypothetical protein